MCETRNFEYAKMTFGPQLEKTCLGFANNKEADQPAHPRRLITAFVTRCLKSILSKLATGERISDTLIGYLPIFQMLPKTSLRIRYHWHPFEKDA